MVQHGCNFGMIGLAILISIYTEHVQRMGLANAERAPTALVSVLLATQTLSVIDVHMAISIIRTAFRAASTANGTMAPVSRAITHVSAAIQQDSEASIALTVKRISTTTTVPLDLHF